ncbi:MAG: hypothetical protein PS018_11670 [bacterium]|nr:hypothetical protein [bacterium]
MAALRKTVEFQTDEEVLRVDCLGNLVDDMKDNILVPFEDVPAFIAWLTKEHAAAVKFGVLGSKSDAQG